MDTRRKAIIALGMIGEKADELTMTARIGRPSIAEEVMDWLEQPEQRGAREALVHHFEEIDAVATVKPVFGHYHGETFYPGECKGGVPGDRYPLG